MPINRLQKDSPRGKGPPPSSPMDENALKENLSLAAQQQDSDLAAKEITDMWEEEEVGGTRWSGGDEDKRYAD